MARMITKNPVKMINSHETFKLCPLTPFHLCPKFHFKEDLKKTQNPGKFLEYSLCSSHFTDSQKLA